MKPLIVAVLSILLIQPSLVLGNTPKQTGDWSAVKSLVAGLNIRVQTKNGKKIDGTINSISDTSITVVVAGKTETIDKSDVKKVFKVERGSRAKSIAIWTGIGAGGGAGGAAALLGATGGSDSTGTIVAIGIAIGAGIGAAIGAAFGGDHRTLVYESK